MSVSFWMSTMGVAEFLLWSTLAFVFWKKGLKKRFRALNLYFLLRVSSLPILLALLLIQQQPWGHQYYPYYFFASWGVYIVSAISLFFVTLEIFRSVLSSFSGLMRLGTIVFRWVALVSALASLTSISYEHRTLALLPDFALALMRSVSILELCLLAFLCLCINALQLSFRDLACGLGLGFGLMSANDLIFSALIPSSDPLDSPKQRAYQIITLLIVGCWTAYLAMPERIRKPVVMPASSTIYRWNEIASALGHGTKVAVRQPANGFFLTDVERVVEKVLTRNLQGESKS
ncbi:MAG: hypothetical protein JST28_02110 [Acidobacteria bacterium]|nr:hypothetical protein [Acidobacteriota bacterium]